MYAPFHFSHTRFIGVYHYLKKQRVCFMSTNPLRLDAWTAEKYAINKELCGKWTSKRALDYFFNVLRRRSGKKTQEKQTNKDIEGKDWIIKKYGITPVIYLLYAIIKTFLFWDLYFPQDCLPLFLHCDLFTIFIDGFKLLEES